MEVRRALPSDAPEISRLEHELYELHAGAIPEIFKAERSNGDLPNQGADGDIVYVAVVGDQIAGYIRGAFRSIDDSAHVRGRKVISIIDLYVCPPFRRSGIVTSLVHQVESLRGGFDAIEIPVYTFNVEARELYRKLGYGSYVERFWKLTKGTHWA